MQKKIDKFVCLPSYGFGSYKKFIELSFVTAAGYTVRLTWWADVEAKLFADVGRWPAAAERIEDTRVEHCV